MRGEDDASGSSSTPHASLTLRRNLSRAAAGVPSPPPHPPPPPPPPPSSPLGGDPAPVPFSRPPSRPLRGVLRVVSAGPRSGHVSSRCGVCVTSSGHHSSTFMDGSSCPVSGSVSRQRISVPPVPPAARRETVFMFYGGQGVLAAPAFLLSAQEVRELPIGPRGGGTSPDARRWRRGGGTDASVGRPIAGLRSVAAPSLADRDHAV